MENNNLNVLDEINKGATMGMDAIDIISDKTKKQGIFFSL